MSIRLRAVIGLSAVMLLAGVSILFGAVLSAAATPGGLETNCDETTCEVYWEMPGSVNGEATWPQKVAYADSLHCATWYQVDRYPKDKIAGLVADGTLTLGEDYGIAISWRFQYGGDCEQSTPPVTETPGCNMAGGPDYHTPDCMTNTPIPTETEEPSSPPTDTSTPSSPPTTTSPSTTPPTGAPTIPPTTTPTEEPTTPDTPSVTPPIETSQPIESAAPSTSNPSTSIPVKVSGVSSTTKTLAATGLNEGVWFGIGTLTILIGLVILILTLTKRKN